MAPSSLHVKLAENGGRASALQASRVGCALEDDPPKLFLLPGSIGYGPGLAAFASALGNVAQIVPIRYPDLRSMLGGENTLLDIAAAATKQINQVQPSGDVRLLGHSLGGAVAFEVATLLIRAGRPVTFLGILDTAIVPEPGAGWTRFTRTYRRIRTSRIAAYRLACRALAKGAVAFGSEARLSSLLDRLSSRQFNPTCFRIKIELQEVLRARAFFAWLAGPKPALPISGALFRCNRTGMPLDLGWERAFANLDVIPIAGGHLDLVSEPHLAINCPLIENAVSRTYLPRARDDQSIIRHPVNCVGHRG